jgi:hypothetical protein
VVARAFRFTTDRPSSRDRRPDGVSLGPEAERPQYQFARTPPRPRRCRRCSAPLPSPLPSLQGTPELPSGLVSTSHTHALIRFCAPLSATHPEVELRGFQASKLVRPLKTRHAHPSTVYCRFVLSRVLRKRMSCEGDKCERDNHTARHLNRRCKTHLQMGSTYESPAPPDLGPGVGIRRTPAASTAELSAGASTTRQSRRRLLPRSAARPFDMQSRQTR